MTTPVPNRRTLLELVAIMLVAAGGFTLALQQGRVNAELDELNERSRENQVLRCYELGLAENPLDVRVSQICIDAFADQEDVP